MEQALTYHHHPQPLSLTHRCHHRRRLSFNSISFPKSASFSSIRARNPNNETRPKPHMMIINPTLKTTFITVAAIFLTRFTLRPAVAVPPPPVATVEEIQQEELKTDHAKDLKNIEKMIIEWMEICDKNYKFGYYRDLKLMLAQILIMRGDYNAALKLYEDLSTEQPRDLKPHLTRGIVYTLLGKKDDAESNFRMAEKIRTGRLLLVSDYIKIATCIIVGAFYLMLFLGLKSQVN